MGSKTIAEQVDFRFLPWRTETLSNSGITHLRHMRPGHWSNRYSLLPHMSWAEAIIWAGNAPIALVWSSLLYTSKKSSRWREIAMMEYILRAVNINYWWVWWNWLTLWHRCWLESSFRYSPELHPCLDSSLNAPTAKGSSHILY